MRKIEEGGSTRRKKKSASASPVPTSGGNKSAGFIYLDENGNIARRESLPEWEYPTGNGNGIDWELFAKNYGNMERHGNGAKRKVDIDNMAFIYDELVKRGYGGNQLYSVLANIIEESGGDPFARSDSGEYQGLFQESLERYPQELRDRDAKMNAREAIVSILDRVNPGIKDGSLFTHGGKGSGYKTRKEASDAFWSTDADLTDVNKAFTLGFERPYDKIGTYINRSNVAMLLRAMQMTPATDRTRGTRMPDGGPVELPEVEIFPDYPKDSPWTLKETLANVLTSNANFARRIRQAGRKSIPDWEVEGAIATHKLGAEIGEDGKVYVYPWVQELDGNLYDFSDPKNGHGDRARWDALDSAIEHGDYIQFPDLETAIWFTERYKDDGLFPKFEDGGDTGNDREAGLLNLLWSLFHPKDAAYKIMRASNGNFQLSKKEILSALMSGDDPELPYTGGRYNYDESAPDSIQVVSPSFDYPHMYIYGEAEGARELTDEEKSRGVDYSSYLREHGRDPQSIKQYAGNFGEDLILPESFKSYFDRVIGTPENRTFGFENIGVDNVAGYLGRINKDSSGNYVVDYSDIWDFEPKSYSENWNVDGKKIIPFIQSYLLDKVGTPFIVRSRRDVRFLPDEEWQDEIDRLFRDHDGWSPETTGLLSFWLVHDLNKLAEESNDNNGIKFSPSVRDALKILSTPFREALSSMGIENDSPDERADGGSTVDDLSGLASRDNTSVGRQRISSSIPSSGVSDAARENPVIPFVASLLPGVGDAIDAYDFIQAAKQRNAIGMALAVAGFIPLVGDALQEYGKMRKLRLEGASRRSLGRTDIKESDEALLDKMPDYAHPDSPMFDALRMHESRLNSGTYERITGRDLNEDWVSDRNLERWYPGIHKKIFDVDVSDMGDDELRTLFEMVESKPVGYFNGYPRAELENWLYNLRHLMYNRSPMYKIGLPGDNAIMYSEGAYRSRFPDDWKLENLDAGISHELDHAVWANASPEKVKEMRSGVNEWFDAEKSGIGGGYFDNPEELAARGTQIKDYFGLTDDAQKITPEMLKYAARHYEDTWLRNNMDEFFNGITDWDKAAEWLSKYATVTIPAAAMPFLDSLSKEVDDDNEKSVEVIRKHGGEIANEYCISEDGTHRISGYTPLYDLGLLHKRKEYIKKRLSGKYGMQEAEAGGLVRDMLPKSLLDANYYDAKNRAYGIGQWSGDDLRDFVMTYENGGLDDQIDFVARRYRKKMEEGGDTSSKSIKEKAGNLLRSIANPRDAAYKIMSNSGGEASLGIGDVLDIILNDGSVGNYTGGTDTGAGSFDFPRMYIYGEAEGAKELPESERRFGADYDDYLRSIGRDPSAVKQYEGDFGTEIFLPESYRAVIDELADTDKNKNIGFDLDYFSEGHDDVAGYLGRVGKDDDGNYVMGYSDLWDFHPEDYSKTWGETGGDFLTYAESWLLNKVGSPFIVRSKKNIRFYPDDEYFGILDDLKSSDGERGVIGENSDMVYRALTRMSGRGFGDYEPIMRDLSAPGVVKMLTALPIRDTQHTGVRTRKSGGPITDAYREYLKVYRGEDMPEEKLVGTSIVPYLPHSLLMKMAYSKGKRGIFGNQELMVMEGGGNTKDIEDYVYQQLTEEYGIPAVQAIGIMANLKQESGFNLKALGDNGKSYGLNQWQGARRKALFDWAKSRGNDTPNLDDQISFLVDEYKNGNGFLTIPGGDRNLFHSGKVNRSTFDYWQYSKEDFDNATNVLDSTRAWAQGFGRGNKEAFNMDRRFNVAKGYAERYGVSLAGNPEYGEMGRISVTDGSESGTDGTPTELPGVTVVAGNQGFTPEMMDYMERYGKSLVEAALKGAASKEDDDGDEESRAMDEDEAKSAAEVAALQRSEARARFASEMLDSIRLNIKGHRTGD